MGHLPLRRTRGDHAAGAGPGDPQPKPRSLRELAVEAPTAQAHAARPDAAEEPQHAVLACKKILHTFGIKPRAWRAASRAYWTGSIAMADAPILITGGAGFIGSHLTDALLAKGYAVRVLDDLSTGRARNLPLDNPAVELIVRRRSRCRAGGSGRGRVASAVAHLAAVASVQASVDDPVQHASEQLHRHAECVRGHAPGRRQARAVRLQRCGLRQQR